MPINSSGVYSLPSPEYPAVSGDVISAANWNAILEDFQSAFNLTLFRDGRAPMSGNLLMGGYSLRNAGIGGTPYWDFPASDGHVTPKILNTCNIGNTSFRVKTVYATELNTGSSGSVGASFLSGLSAPEGAVSAAGGSIYTNRSGGAGTTLYVKRTSQVGNTGWFAVA